ncbi:glycosyltransferase involved in cell wall biosynthesis [Ereboglobus sp. PH5-5]|uniref:glycosyltransferase family 2 protein n=1 Tax=Ereboglobus sp. PH5-5 TaxID=2940529 RepID=UPI002404E48E|nr:glycosyltransferase family 2 protein [Ereboglobus sp. PH5-5]MDF9833995.1 glycosyltransferase involved in cell wall biosynthesis [Ereboglobus sp. PH5-5]
MKTITVVSGCYNEEANLPDLISRVFAVAKKFPQYNWEYIIIDNCSTDKSGDVLRAFAGEDRRIKVIFNVRNFGFVRSFHHALLQARGDAVIYLASDLQDPPEIIEQFIPLWEQGRKVVAAIKNRSKESRLMFAIRSFYYDLIGKLADVTLLKNFTGFGLYDREVIQHLREMGDPYPYFRGQISELGYPVATIDFEQPVRKRGKSSFNFYALYDIAMLGFTSHTKVPLRLAAFTGFILAALSFLTGMVYLVFKLIYWYQFSIGIAPLVVGFFFLGAVQLIFIGILGEYIGAIHTKVTKRPLVVERERLNF